MNRFLSAKNLDRVPLSGELISARTLSEGTRVRRAIICIWFFLLIPGPDYSPAQGGGSSSPPKRVLLICSFGFENSGPIVFMQTFRKGLIDAMPDGVDFHVETLEFNRFPGEHTEIVRDYLGRKYGGTKLDVIAVMHDTGLEFLLKYRDELFPGVPMVYLRNTPPEPGVKLAGVTGVWTGLHLDSTLDIALKLHPSIRQVFVVSGKLNNNGILEAEARTRLKPYEERVVINCLTDMSIDELRTRDQ